MFPLKTLTIKDRMILALAKTGARAFVFSTRFGKQTHAKRAIQTLWKQSHK